MEKVVNMATDLRPKKFTDMTGQPYAKGLGRQIGKGIISGQGYMLIGPKGCGKTSLARILAKSLNCQNRDSETGNPCDECASCVQYNKGVHRTIKEINAASYRGINDMREKLKDIHEALPEGYKRVYIIDEAHLLSTDAFSYFLKPLEEHSENIIFIFTTTNPEKILDTIVSRLSQIPIKELSNDDLRTIVTNAVEEGKKTGVEDWNNITETDIEHAVLSASGSPRQAITNISGVVYHGIHPSVSKSSVDPIVDKFIEGSTAGVLSLCSEILLDKTSDPASLISLIIYGLFDNLNKADSKDVGVLARQISDLSQVLDFVTSSTPAVITAAKIAACVPQKVQVLESASAKVSKPATAPKLKKMAITPQTKLEEVFDFLYNSQLSKSNLTKKWRDILDDEDQSDISIDNGVLVISVDSPTSVLTEGLNKVFDKVSVMRRNSLNSVEPPF